MTEGFTFEPGQILTMLHEPEKGIKGKAMCILEKWLGWDHTSYVMKINGQLKVAESSFPGGVKETDLDEWLESKNGKLKKMVVSTPKWKFSQIKATKRVLFHLGQETKYDKAGLLFWMFWWYLLQELFPEIRYLGPQTEMKATSGFWCSEFVGFITQSHDFFKWTTLTPLDEVRFNILKTFES